VDGTSFGEKKAFTIPWNATVVNVNIIDEDHRPLVTESLHEKFSQLVSISYYLSHTPSLRNLIGHSHFAKVAINKQILILP